MSAPANARAQRRLVVDVGLDGAGPEALEPLAAGRGARHAGHAVAGGKQFTDGAAADHARRSGDHDLVHTDLTTPAARS